MSLRFLHTMVRVGDLDGALDFFCDKLGLMQTKRYDSDEGRFSLIYLAAPHDLTRAKEERSPELELTYNWDDTEYTGGRNFGHLAYEVDDIYQACQRLMDKGVTISRPPVDGHMAFVISPDGISIELLQKGQRLEPQEPWASMPKKGSW
jgi:lactoylglutathione lyase